MIADALKYLRELAAESMAVSLTREWLLANGIEEDLLDSLLDRSAPSPGPGKARSPVLVLADPPRLETLESGPGWWRATILNYRPCSDNLRARGVRAWGRGKARDREVIRELLCEQAGIPPATGKRKVTLVVSKKDGRGVRDAGNLLKSLHDSLVTTGLLIDDDERFLDWDRPRIVIDREQACRVLSVIRLEDVDLDRD